MQEAARAHPVTALHDGGRVQLAHPVGAGFQGWTACQSRHYRYSYSGGYCRIEEDGDNEDLHTGTIIFAISWLTLVNPGIQYVCIIDIGRKLRNIKRLVRRPAGCSLRNCCMYQLQIQRSFGADACMSFMLGSQRVHSQWMDVKRNT